MKISHPHFFQYILGKIIGFLYRLLTWTYRYSVVFEPGLDPINFYQNPEKSYIFSCWHRDDVSMLGFCINKKFMTLISDSKDGTILASALTSLGIEVRRGSSTRGGVKGMLGMLHSLEKRPYFATIAVDGPKGPAFKAKPGIHFLALKMNSINVHGVAELDSYWTLKKTWMKTRIPKPFSKVTIHFYPLPKANEQNQEAWLDKIHNIPTY